MGKYLIKNKNVTILDSKIIRGEKALVAQKKIELNTIIFLYQDVATEVRTRTSIQVAFNKHIEPGEFGCFANHSCSPNAHVIANYDEETNVAEVLMIAIKPIELGEEITFDYATTESTVTPELLRKPCLCGSNNCRKIITGFDELTHEDKMCLFVKGLTANYLQIKD